MVDAYDAADPRLPSEQDAAPVTEEERAAALQQLRRGYDDGWLTPDEHELRDTLARRARTRAELARALRPGLLGGEGADGRAPLQWSPDMAENGSDPTGSTAVVAGEAQSNPGSGLVLLPGRVVASVHTLAWVAAVAGFFETGQWWWFLAIPLAHALFGARGMDVDSQERRRARRARRDARRIRRGRPPISGEVVRRDEETPD